MSKEKGHHIEQIEEALCLMCDLCQQKFCNKKYLEVHMEELHHNSEDSSVNSHMHVSIIKCETCGNQFNNKDDLAIHIKEKNLSIPISAISYCKCAVIDSVCDYCWENCEWIKKNSSKETQ